MILMGGEFAMQTSQLALERARMPAVRNFAQLEINEQLGVAASLGGTPGATPLRPDQAALVQQLAALSGPRFDRMYVEGQVLGHEELLALNTTVLRSRADPTGVTVANLAVPSIQTHLRVLNRLQQGGMPV
jgi:putative membrane protein